MRSLIAVKNEKKVVSAVLGLLLVAGLGIMPAKAYGAGNGAAQTAGAKSFLGRWDLTLKAPDHEYPSWIDIEEQNGQLTAQFVSRWGNARPLPKIAMDGTHITFVSPKEEEERKDDMVFEGTLTGKALSGTTTGQDGT